MKNKGKLIGVLAVALLIGASVFGVLAYLTAQTDPVTNTFAAANLTEGEFVLKEHEATRGDNGEYTLSTSTEVNKNDYTVVPGATLPKDPFVRVKVTERAYLFLEVIDSLPEGMTWSMDTGNWQKLMDGDNEVKLGEHPIYVYKGSSVTDNVIPAGTEIEAANSNIIDAKQITVANDFNVTLLNVEEGQPAKTLEFKAYLTQATEFATPLAAWQATYGATTPTP